MHRELRVVSARLVRMSTRMIVNAAKPHSDYLTMIRVLKANLVDEKECRYFVHTPLGRIDVGRFHFMNEKPGFLVIEGLDDSGEHRFLMFPEQQALFFPLEVSRKGKKSNKTLGFKGSEPGDSIEVKTSKDK